MIPNKTHAMRPASANKASTQKYDEMFALASVFFKIRDYEQSIILLKNLLSLNDVALPAKTRIDSKGLLFYCYALYNKPTEALSTFEEYVTDSISFNQGIEFNLIFRFFLVLRLSNELNLAKRLSKAISSAQNVDITINFLKDCLDLADLATAKISSKKFLEQSLALISNNDYYIAIKKENLQNEKNPPKWLARNIFALCVAFSSEFRDYEFSLEVHNTLKRHQKLGYDENEDFFKRIYFNILMSFNNTTAIMKFAKTPKNLGVIRSERLCLHFYVLFLANNFKKFPDTSVISTQFNENLKFLRNLGPLTPYEIYSCAIGLIFSGEYEMGLNIFKDQVDGNDLHYLLAKLLYEYCKYNLIPSTVLSLRASSFSMKTPLDNLLELKILFLENCKENIDKQVIKERSEEVMSFYKKLQ